MGTEEGVLLDDMVCAQVQKRINERLDDHDEVLKEHGARINRLDCSDAVNTKAIKDLCKQLGGLIKAIWGLALSIGTIGVSFIIWYIQNAGRLPQ